MSFKKLYNLKVIKLKDDFDKKKLGDEFKYWDFIGILLNKIMYVVIFMSWKNLWVGKLFGKFCLLWGWSGEMCLLLLKI